MWAECKQEVTLKQHNPSIFKLAQVRLLSFLMGSGPPGQRITPPFDDDLTTWKHGTMGGREGGRMLRALPAISSELYLTLGRQGDDRLGTERRW